MNLANTFGYGGFDADKTTPLHPSVRHGYYAERHEIDQGVLEAQLERWLANARREGPRHRARWQIFLQQIRDHENQLQDLSDTQFDAQVERCRQQLRNQGLDQKSIAYSFAIVCEAAFRTLKMRHHDVQRIGGWIMLEGMIAEMQTGEGKTLTATLAASTAALAGIPTHVVSVNDYLVQRDAEEMSPIYNRLGLRVATITESLLAEQRREAYAADITYCTSNQLAFDYLKDRMVLRKIDNPLQLKLSKLISKKYNTEELLLRGLYFAIVDEADSVFIDEARTPLVLSSSTNHKEEEQTYSQALWIASKLSTPKHYAIDHAQRLIDLLPAGKEYLVELGESIGGVWRGTRRREMLVKQALSAENLFIKDRDYLIREEKIVIIDDNTGRVMADRQWERGLHHMIEIKESCEVSGRRDTLAKISYQKFFRRYLRVGGMSGTVSEVARELADVYKLNIVPVPTHKPSKHIVLCPRIYVTAAEKWRAVVQHAKQYHKQQRAVLLGTTTLAESEHLSDLLQQGGLDHRVLNARQDREEADIVSKAGGPGRVTVATNMAGRGTDIKLSADVKTRGGLHVIACALNTSARVDRQLIGRCARQGDPGSYQAILSLEDDLITQNIPNWLVYSFRIASRIINKNGQVPARLGMFLMRLSQTINDYRNRKTRKTLLAIDDSRDRLLAFSGRAE